MKKKKKKGIKYGIYKYTDREHGSSTERVVGAGWKNALAQYSSIILNFLPELNHNVINAFCETSGTPPQSILYFQFKARGRFC